MRLEMLNKMVLEIRMLGRFQSKSRKSNISVSRSTKSNWDFDWIWISRYLSVQIQNEIFVEFEFAVDFNLPSIQDLDYH